jgi:hypothetical protein
VAKDWEMSLGVVENEFFYFLKFMDWERLLGTLGDALTNYI